MSAIALAAGTTRDRTVKTTVLLTDPGEFAAVNEVYGAFFNESYPARACYQVVAQPKSIWVEVKAVIALN